MANLDFASDRKQIRMSSPLSSSGTGGESKEPGSPGTTVTHVSQTQLGPEEREGHSTDGDNETEGKGEEQDGELGHVLGMAPFILDPTPIQNGYLAEESLDEEFQKHLLNAFLLQYRVWSTTRPETEIQAKMEGLNVKYNEIMVREREQEQTRQNYADLLHKVRTLLIAMAATL